MTEFDMRKLTGGRPIQFEPRKIFALVWGAAGVIVVLWGIFTSFYTVEAIHFHLRLGILFRTMALTTLITSL